MYYNPLNELKGTVVEVFIFLHFIFVGVYFTNLTNYFITYVQRIVSKTVSLSSLCIFTITDNNKKHSSEKRKQVNSEREWKEGGGKISETE